MLRLSWVLVLLALTPLVFGQRRHFQYRYVIDDHDSFMQCCEEGYGCRRVNWDEKPTWEHEDEDDDCGGGRCTTSTYTKAEGCVVTLANHDHLPTSSEERASMFRDEQTRLREEELALQERVHKLACELSAPMIEKGRELAREAMKCGRKSNAYPLPIAERALDTLRESLPEGYHVHVEDWDDVYALVDHHVVTPGYELHSSHSLSAFGKRCTTYYTESLDYQTMYDHIRAEIPEQLEHSLSEPILLFTLYWDCTEEEFLARRMDTWVRHEEFNKQCDLYDRCKEEKFVDAHYNIYTWPWEWVPKQWIDMNEPLPPHPRDL